MSSIAHNVVVGVDGSPDGRAALDWAARLVGTHGVLHAVHALPPSEALLAAVVQDEWTEVRNASRRDLEGTWTHDARGDVGDLVCHLVDAAPAEALVRIATEIDSALIVVGAHGRSRNRPGRGSRSAIVGSVTHRLLRESDVPVVVVPFIDAPSSAPGSTKPAPIGAGATLVVGIGHGRATGAALDWAAACARERATSIELVHVVNHQPLFLPSRTMEQALEKAAERLAPALLTEWAEEDLADVASELSGRPGMDAVPITRRVEFGPTGPSLVAASSAAAVLVMGRRCDAPFTGYFTSAALHHVLTHARVPVVVAPQPHDRR